jgi:hypothetical protein
MSTLTDQQRAAIAAKLEGMTLPSGLGDNHAACSIAAINLALSGRLTDDIPACMSEVIGQWIITIQDAMPDQMRNSPDWKRLLPLAAGTGREHEDKRLALILEWMWGTVLPLLQPQADAGGYGPQWRAMCEQRTPEAAKASWAAAEAARAAWAAEAAEAARAAAAEAAWAAEASWAAAEAARAAWAAEAAEAARAAAAEAAWAAWAAAAAAKARAAEAAAEAAWRHIDPCGLLARLVEVQE